MRRPSGVGRRQTADVAHPARHHRSEHAVAAPIRRLLSRPRHGTYGKPPGKTATAVTTITVSANLRSARMRACRAVRTPSRFASTASARRASSSWTRRAVGSSRAGCRAEEDECSAEPRILEVSGRFLSLVHRDKDQLGVHHVGFRRWPAKRGRSLTLQDERARGHAHVQRLAGLLPRSRLWCVTGRQTAAPIVETATGADETLRKC